MAMVKEYLRQDEIRPCRWTDKQPEFNEFSQTLELVKIAPQSIQEDIMKSMATFLQQFHCPNLSSTEDISATENIHSHRRWSDQFSTIRFEHIPGVLLPKLSKLILKKLHPSVQ